MEVLVLVLVVVAPEAVVVVALLFLEIIIPVATEEMVETVRRLLFLAHL